MRGAEEYRAVVERFRYLGKVAAHVWNLPLRDIRVNEALLDCFGRCWYAASIIEIRFTSLKSPAKLLPIWHLRDTLAHELAHIKEHGHTKAHRALRDAIKLWLKSNWDRKGFNRPVEPQQPKQSRKKRPH